jgi:hypothetical protein
MHFAKTAFNVIGFFSQTLILSAHPIVFITKKNRYLIIIDLSHLGFLYIPVLNAFNVHGYYSSRIPFLGF